MKKPEFVTVQEAAQELGVSDAAVRKAILKGRLPFTVLFSRKLISVRDLAAYKARSQPDGVKRTGRPPKIL